MCGNNTLEELHTLFFGVVKGVEAFSTVLKRNTSLRKLTVAWDWDQDHHRPWVEEIPILDNALSQNKSLLQLKVYVPNYNSRRELETKDARMQFIEEEISEIFDIEQ